MIRLVGLILLLLTSACNETILHKLDERVANRVVLTLEGSGVQAKKIPNGDSWAIEVPSKLAAKALRSLRDKRTFSQLDKNTPSFKSSLVSGREERKAIQDRIKIYRLENSLRSLPSVLEAWVHLNRVESGSRVFGGNKRKSSASVLIISEDPQRLDEIQIKRLVSGAVGTNLPVIEVIIEKSEPFFREEVPVIERKSQVLLNSPKWDQRKAAIFGSLALAVGAMTIILKPKKGLAASVINEKKQGLGFGPDDLLKKGERDD